MWFWQRPPKEGLRYGGYNLPATPGFDMWDYIFGINDEEDTQADLEEVDDMNQQIETA